MTPSETFHDHVSLRGRGWAVLWDGEPKPGASIRVFMTRAEAEEHAEQTKDRTASGVIQVYYEADRQTIVRFQAPAIP